MTQVTDSFIVIKGLCKAFRGHPILKDIDLKIYPGELTAIVGRSGCGKSTLLRCLNGVEQFDSGTIVIGSAKWEYLPSSKGKPVGLSDAQVHQLRKNFGMVFQDLNLFPHLTLLENMVKAPMVVKKMNRGQAEALARPLLAKVGLLSHIAHYPSQLSGGQQQRAAIARALAMEPRVMLYDEPTSALDPWLSEEVFQVMRKISSEKMTQVVVTHDLRFVREFADRVVFIENGEVVEVGTPQQLFDQPQDRRTQQYLGKFAS